MRRGFLALLVLFGCGSVAFAQGGQLPTSKVSTDAVVARIMTFDQNSDGRVSIGELSERMRPLVERGDKDGDRALSRSEIVALSRAPSTRARQVFPQNGGYSFGEDTGLSSRQHIEGALEDLRLTSDRTERARPRIRTYLDRVEAAAKQDLLRQLEPLMSQEHFLDFTGALNNPSSQVALRTNADGAAATRMFRLMVGGDLARRVDMMKLVAPRNEQARKAIDEFKTRIRLGREAERVALLAQLKDVLSVEELADFRAAIERRPVVANGASLVALNVERRAVRPAVLTEQTFTLGVPVR